MTVGITFSAFDLLHAGHTRFLHDCRERCDKLVIGLHVDPSLERPNSKNKPVQSVTERYMLLEIYADQIIPYQTELDLWNIVATVPNLNYYFLGSDYNGWVPPPKLAEIIAFREIDIVKIPRLHNYSTTELRNRIQNVKT